MKKICLTIALALCCVAVLGVIGCEDVATTTTTTTATVSAETTSTAPAETTTTAASTSTTAAPTTTSKAPPKATTTTPPTKAGPAPKEHLLKGTWEWDVDADGTPDIWYQIVDELVHYLVPVNGAEFAQITGKTFAAVGLSDLHGAAYSSNGLATEGVDDPNVLMPGDIIGLRTDTARYAKLKVAGFEPHTAPDGIVYSRYYIRLQYVLY